jgi:hypothetical protein
VLDNDTVAFLERGCALIVAVGHPDGTPLACRGWGLDVLDAERGLLRLLLPDDDVVAGLLADPVRIAVTGCDVRSLHSLQLKGTTMGVEPARDDDTERVRRYADEFFADIHAADGTPIDRPARMLPDTVMVCRFVVEEIYDQTPGPAAGARRPSGES